MDTYPLPMLACLKQQEPLRSRVGRVWTQADPVTSSFAVSPLGPALQLDRVVRLCQTNRRGPLSVCSHVSMPATPGGRCALAMSRAML